jgi:hypothetical protein
VFCHRLLLIQISLCHRDNEIINLFYDTFKKSNLINCKFILKTILTELFSIKTMTTEKRNVACKDGKLDVCKRIVATYKLTTTSSSLCQGEPALVSDAFINANRHDNIKEHFCFLHSYLNVYSTFLNVEYTLR